MQTCRQARNVVDCKTASRNAIAVSAAFMATATSPAELVQGTRIRNHIAHLEAQVAATGGMAIGSCEANKGTFETSNGSIDTDSESYDPILDRLDSTDPVLSQDFQDSTLDEFEAFMNHSPDNAIDHNLTDIFQSSMDRSSPILSNEYPPKKNAVLPTPTSEGMMPDCLRHSNAAEAARRNDHDNDQQLDLDSDFTHHACNCAEKNLGPTVRKRKWPSRIHNSTRSSPSIAVSGDATPPKQYQKLSQHTQHDQSNRDSASLIPSSCCEHHENHRSCTAKRTMQNSKKAIENPTKASSCVSERAGLPIPYPSPAENGHHDYHLSQAREVSKSHYNRKSLSRINMKPLRSGQLLLMVIPRQQAIVHL